MRYRNHLAWMLPAAGLLLLVAVVMPASAQSGPVAVATAGLQLGEVGAAYESRLEANGGASPYSWAITAGALPDGLALNATTGSIAGTPTEKGTFDLTVQVTDSGGVTDTAALSLTVAAAVSVDTAALPDAERGVAYSHTLTVAGGVAPYAWSLAGGTLPAGLALDADTGVVSGTPTAAQSAAFTVRVDDGVGGTATRALSLTVTEPVSVETTALPNATFGVAYEQTLAAADGVSPYTWAISAGALPAGLAMETTTGVIAGTPSANGTATFTVQVTDAAGGVASRELSLTVQASLPPTITTTELPKAKVGVAYSHTLTTSGGASPMTWSIVAGSLPAGLSLNATSGVIAGTPTAHGTEIFAVKVEDANGAMAARVLTLKVKSADKPDADVDDTNVRDAKHTKVIGACDDDIDSHPALSALCRIYLSGQLGAPAQEVIGRVILKLDSRHEARFDARSRNKHHDGDRREARVDEKHDDDGDRMRSIDVRQKHRSESESHDDDRDDRDDRSRASEVKHESKAEAKSSGARGADDRHERKAKKHDRGVGHENRSQHIGDRDDHDDDDRKSRSRWAKHRSEGKGWGVRGKRD